MMTSKDPYIIYYTNDYEKYVDKEMEMFKENGVDAFESGRWDRQSAVDIIIEKLKNHELLGTPLKDESGLEKLKSLINVKGKLENYTDDEMDDIILAAMENKDLNDTITEAYNEYLWDDPWLIPDLIENGEEMADEFLKADNWFIAKKDVPLLKKQLEDQDAQVSKKTFLKKGDRIGCWTIL